METLIALALVFAATAPHFFGEVKNFDPHRYPSFERTSREKPSGALCQNVGT